MTKVFEDDNEKIDEFIEDSKVRVRSDEKNTTKG